MSVKVVLDGNYLHVGNKRLALLSGEFHFWRNNKKRWRQILTTIKDGGLELVSTYVSWGFQETAPGKHDFVGATNGQRDLDGFLRLCGEMGLYVMLRPGPYILGEFPHCGPPEHAVRACISGGKGCFSECYAFGDRLASQCGRICDPSTMQARLLDRWQQR